MKVHFLGTNGWHDTETGETPCILIDAKEAYIIFDAGNSFRKLDRYVTDTKKPIFLFLSHFHLDHVNGLHTLMKFGFPQGITIYGQPGTRKILDMLINRPFTGSLELVRKRMPIEVNELNEGEHDVGIKVKCNYLIHADPCFGYRIEVEGKIITYCTDTGVCDAVVELGKNADLLITECAWKERNQYKEWPHLAPEDAAEMAKKANAKMLALTHFDALNYQSKNERKMAERKAITIFKNSRAMFDDEFIEI